MPNPRLALPYSSEPAFHLLKSSIHSLHQCVDMEFVICSPFSPPFKLLCTPALLVEFVMFILSLLFNSSPFSIFFLVFESTLFRTSPLSFSMTSSFNV